MKRVFIAIMLICSLCFMMNVKAASDSEIKKLITDFASDISNGNLEALDYISSDNRKLKNNLTTYMDSMKLTQEVKKIKEKNGVYTVTAKGKLKYNDEKESNVIVEYEIKDDMTTGLTIISTDLFDNVGHGSLISGISSLITISLIIAVVGSISYFVVKKRNEKELNHMRNNEGRTGLGGLMDKR